MPSSADDTEGFTAATRGESRECPIERIGLRVDSGGGREGEGKKSETEMTKEERQRHFSAIARIIR